MTHHIDDITRLHLEEQEIVPECVSFFLELITLQSTNLELFNQQIANPDFIQKIQENLQLIPTAKLLDICGNNQRFQTYLLQIPFLERENKLYRENTGRKNIRATWSDKLMSLVGSLDGTYILSGVLNHEGDPVRTKVDDHYKAAEAAEVMAIHAAYLDGGEPSITKVMAEVADGVYNLTQLLSLDPDPETSAKYEKYLEQLTKILGVSRASMLTLAIAKYHHRTYYSKEGRNAHQSEDRLVLQALSRYFPHLLNDTDEAKRIINDSFMHFNKMFRKLQTILVKKFIKEYPRLDKKSQYILEKTVENSMNIIKLLADDLGLGPIVIGSLAQEED
ncbi:MAG: hypothetical protein BroJett025_00840 [Patescibacteria group bacterium]|nr:MAG: hypothetical protein BroJett025_00840 [Patescibacteria group bacterium]